MEYAYYIRREVWVARSDEKGNAKASQGGASDNRLHAFLFNYCSIGGHWVEKSMQSQFLSDFKTWLLSNRRLSTERSAASYVSRLKRAFRLWDKHSSFMRPIESNLNALALLSCTNAAACENIFITMLGYVGAEYAAGRWLYGATNDVATAVRTFHEFLASRFTGLSHTFARNSIHLKGWSNACWWSEVKTAPRAISGKT